MASNIEIKARVDEFKILKIRAESLSDTPLEIIQQEDTFFFTPTGRLKLRVMAPDLGELIYYDRPDQEGPKHSEYYLAKTQDPENLKTILSMALGIRGVVVKTRYLYNIGQTRIHLDNVDKLGQFVELEVVLRNGQNEAQGQAIAKDLMGKLGIGREALIKGAYMDLLESQEG